MVQLTNDKTGKSFVITALRQQDAEQFGHLVGGHSTCEQPRAVVASPRLGLGALLIRAKSAGDRGCLRGSRYLRSARTHHEQGQPVPPRYAAPQARRGRRWYRERLAPVERSLEHPRPHPTAERPTTRA